MPRENFNDLFGFLTVARERSFTRAAAQLGLSPSALNHSIQGLEQRLGPRLLSRATRSVAPTEAGERLLFMIAPRSEEIESDLLRLRDLKDRPAGAVRPTAADHPVDAIRWPKPTPLLRAYPDVRVEIIVDYGDIVAERCDAGVRDLWRPLCLGIRTPRPRRARPRRGPGRLQQHRPDA